VNGSVRGWPQAGLPGAGHRKRAEPGVGPAGNVRVGVHHSSAVVSAKRRGADT